MKLNLKNYSVICGVGALDFFNQGKNTYFMEAGIKIRIFTQLSFFKALQVAMAKTYKK